MRWDEKLTCVFRSIGETKDLRKGMFDGIDDPIVITGVQFIPFDEKRDD